MISVNIPCQPFEMADTDEMHVRLRWAREKAGFPSAMMAAKKLQWPTSTYAAHENGQNKYGPQAAAKYAKAFKVNAGWLLTGEGRIAGVSGAPVVDLATVTVVGIAGAGPSGEIQFLDDGSELGRAPAPVSWTISTVALEVRGNSMRPMAYDGWYAYYEENKTNLTEDMFGEPCVVCLDDGRVLIKIPYQGSTKSTFNLESVNPAYDTLRDERVRWASLITAFIPRRAARRILEAPEGEAGV